MLLEEEKSENLQKKLSLNTNTEEHKTGIV